MSKRWDLQRQLNGTQNHAHPWQALPCDLLSCDENTVYLTLCDREIYASYAEARILTNRLDIKTKQILELVQDVYKECHDDVHKPVVWFSITLPIHLAHVLQRLGVDPQKQKE